jgi:hypothetical protein
MPLMIPNAPQFSRYESNLPATPAAGTPGTTVNHYASGPHVKNPTYTELIASTAADYQLIVVSVGNNNSSNADSSTLLDIAIGAASSETVIIPDIAAGFVGSVAQVSGYRHHYFPLYVPSGSRLSARTQSVLTSGSVRVLVQLYGGPRNPDAWWYGHHVTTYGHNAANSAGTKFTPGNSGAEGTGVSLGTTTAQHECLVLGVQGHPDDVSWSSVAYHLDVGFDSSSTEWVEGDRYMAMSAATEYIGAAGLLWWPIFRTVASGTELMVRGECSGTADALSAVIHGIS